MAHAAADSDDSADVSPTPAHHHKHAHLKKAASPSPADEEEASPTPKASHKRAADEGASDSDVTPASKRRKHHHTVEADDSADAIPTARPAPSPAESDGADSDSATPKPRPSPAPDASLDSEQLEEFSKQPEKIQTLIESSLDLTRQNLTYLAASDDPSNGGMDCSGFVYYVLTQAGVRDVPRDASGQYSWVRKAGKFRAVISRRLDGFELDELKPGDLLFWSGTYKTTHDPPVTHTMIYLGREKETGNRVMVGSTDGRSFHGLRHWGVSVFDFKAMAGASPSPEGESPQFIGYGAIPGL